MALYLMVAWRIHKITMAGRAYPDAPCDGVFEPRGVAHHLYHAASPPPAAGSTSASRDGAGPGPARGFLARTGDGEPGITSLWQGYQRLHEFIYALETHRTVNAL